MGCNYLSISKFQRLQRWSLETDKLFHPTPYNGVIIPTIPMKTADLISPYTCQNMKWKCHVNECFITLDTYIHTAYIHKIYDHRPMLYIACHVYSYMCILLVLVLRFLVEVEVIDAHVVDRQAYHLTVFYHKHDVTQTTWWSGTTYSSVNSYVSTDGCTGWVRF